MLNHFTDIVKSMQCPPASRQLHSIFKGKCMVSMMASENKQPSLRHNSAGTVIQLWQCGALSFVTGSSQCRGRRCQRSRWPQTRGQYAVYCCWFTSTAAGCSITSISLFWYYPVYSTTCRFSLTVPYYALCIVDLIFRCQYIKASML